MDCRSTYLIAIIVIVLINVSSIHGFDGRGVYPATMHRCTSYCNEDNRQQYLQCPDSKYCCGNETYRYCCIDQSLDVSKIYDEVCGCPQSSCNTSTFVSWPAMFGVFALVLTLLLLAICCCQCFIRYSCPCTNTQRDNTARMTLANRRPRTSRVGSIQISTVSVNINENDTPPPPNSQHVILTPPDYETIYKDLPKYDDLILSANLVPSDQSGYVNSAFTPDADSQNNLSNITGVSRESMSSEDSHSIGLPPRADEDSYSMILPPSADDDSLSTHSDSLPPPYLP